jgi:hypothetical protein
VCIAPSRLECGLLAVEGPDEHSVLGVVSRVPVDEELRRIVDLLDEAVVYSLKSEAAVPPRRHPKRGRHAT